MERAPMPTIPQRIASAFAVLCGQYGDATEMAQDRGQSRQSLYSDAQQADNAVDGSAAAAGGPRRRLGSGHSVKAARVRRRAAVLPDLDDSLAVFHTLREGGRALRKTWGAAARALQRADPPRSVAPIRTRLRQLDDADR